ncbi:uncharacterized protein BJ171DRAFT_491718 [Polychytrium aggregatum]|uniref:uncharacterized protein n=1 Tax=Polychytrium aggregatum TaxID=110093 RepID=UPI0022FDCCC7|nr:uncharacterized protein BJ171DRAFT_491718 [Polychytrium aggregatum]KAI9207857.1 hypothetical protein BJ171DRAFT_491718 [Polychytrium aggregatum]
MRPALQALPGHPLRTLWGGHWRYVLVHGPPPSRAIAQFIAGQQQWRRIHRSSESIHADNFGTVRRMLADGLKWGLGLASLSVFLGLGWYWSLGNPYPRSVRIHLRKALYSHSYGNPHDAEVEYLRALDECIKEGFAIDSPEVSGIVIRLGELYQKVNRPAEAAFTYSQVFEQSFSNGTISAEAEGTKMMGAIRIALKIASALEEGGNLSGSAMYLEWAVKMLIGLPENPPRLKNSQVLEGEPSNLPPQRPPPNPMRSVQVAPWATLRDLGQSLNQLAGVYAGQAKHELAISLYLKAAQILNEDDGDSLVPEERSCQLAVIANNIADCRVAMGSKHWGDALKWVEQSIKLSKPLADQGNCRECFATGLYNLGMIHEMKKDYALATKWFTRARDYGKELEFRECEIMAVESLKRIEQTTGC